MAGTWEMQLFLLCFTPALLAAVKINAKGREVIYLAQGESVKLGCPYELEPEDQGPNGLDIEWTQLNADPTSLDSVILSYQGQQVIHPGYPYVQQRGGPRVNFALPDPSQYDASINLQNVQTSDSATYECKVKKTTVATRKVTITVLERPSTPQCSIEGRVAMGRGITLRCAAHAGSSPLLYQWSKEAERPFGNWPLPATAKGLNPGDLVIQSLSREHVGIYQCTVANKVGSVRCTLEVSFSADSNQVGIIVGAVFGSLLLLLLLLGLTVALICCCRRKRDKEQANQIRVDTAPPRRRAESRNSSLRSILGYMPYNLSFSQRRKYEPPKEQEGVEMVTPASDTDLSLHANCSNAGSESRKSGCPSRVTTQARIHCPPNTPSSARGKTGVTASSSQSPSGANPGSSSGTSSRDPAQGKQNHPSQYGGVPVMVSAQSRDGLVV
ncbi:V-set and immunoglobulin domain-containing protein 8 [Hemicordylus capensis]|uniref:V-set and immunoglobulin domain-containing protein 8 n=1 Tax=Hemicordylus capensis TaxID=884348 RepID=UPI002303A0FD|nr:V-set and immunoglobulin domain-containing protein 8 [Hemicordylus capensis]